MCWLTGIEGVKERSVKLMVLECQGLCLFYSREIHGFHCDEELRKPYAPAAVRFKVVEQIKTFHATSENGSRMTSAPCKPSSASALFVSNTRATRFFDIDTGFIKRSALGISSRQRFNESNRSSETLRETAVGCACIICIS
jgi:hypothetical protein